MVERCEQLQQDTDETQIAKGVIDVIQSRRSLREAFIDKPVPPEDIEEILKSGLRAPSSKNAQPWRIHVLERGERLSKIADSVQYAKDADSYVPVDPATGKPRRWDSTVALSAQVLRDVSLGLFVENRGEFSGGRKALVSAIASGRNQGVVGYSFEMIGLGAMVENMWLTANALGLGGLFMGDVLVAEDEIQTELDFEGDLVGVLALGYTSHVSHTKVLKPDSIVYHHPDDGGLQLPPRTDLTKGTQLIPYPS